MVPCRCWSGPCWWSSIDHGKLVSLGWLIDGAAGNVKLGQVLLWSDDRFARNELLVVFGIYTATGTFRVGDIDLNFSDLKLSQDMGVWVARMSIATLKVLPGDENLRFWPTETQGSSLPGASGRTCSPRIGRLQQAR